MVTASSPQQQGVARATAAFDDPTYTVPLFINGEEIRPSADNNLTSHPVLSPTTRATLWQHTAADDAICDAAVKAAADAFPAWSKTSFKTRRDALLAAAEKLTALKNEIVECVTLETGATEFWGRYINMGLAIEMLREGAGNVGGQLQDKGYMADTATEGRSYPIIHFIKLY